MQNNAIEIRDQREKEWYWMNNLFIDLYASLVGPHAVAVYSVLCRHSNNETQKCFPSMETIGTKTGIKSRKTVSQAIKVLQEFGIIDVETAQGSDGKRLNNIYHLRHPKHWRTVLTIANIKDAEEAMAPEQDLMHEIATREIEKVALKIDMAMFPWLDHDAWQEWVAYKKEKKQVLKPSTIKLQIKLLEKNKADHVEIIHASIRNGWTGLFPLKKFGVRKVEAPSGKYAHVSK